MTIDEIYEMWEKDSDISVANLSAEAINIPKLHNKYFKFYVNENLRLKKMRTIYKEQIHLKTEYYKGNLDSEELKEYNWPPQPIKILRQDIPQYLESDKDLIRISLKIGLQEAIVEYLESILRQINNRGYQLKTILDWEKFKTGA